MLLARPKFLHDHTSLAVWLFVLASVWLSVTAVFLWRGFVRGPSMDNAITRIVERHNHLSDGRAFHIQIGENRRQIARVVLVRESANMPLTNPDSAKLASQASMIAHDPPDPAQSGIWIDGRRRQLPPTLMVIYISDKIPATQIAIPPSQQTRFLEDARTADGFDFIAKWVRKALLQHS